MARSEVQIFENHIYIRYYIYIVYKTIVYSIYTIRLVKHRGGIGLSKERM